MSGLNTKGGRVRARSSYDVKHQSLQCTSQIEHSAVVSQAISGLKYCKELINAMNLELGRVSEVKISQASLTAQRLRSFVSFANVLAIK